MVSNRKRLHSVLQQFKNNFFFCYQSKRLKFEVEKVMIWQYFSISGKHRHTLFLVFVLCPSHIKNYIITGLVSNFFYTPCNRVTSFLQKRNHHKFTFQNTLGMQLSKQSACRFPSNWQTNGGVPLIVDCCALF